MLTTPELDEYLSEIRKQVCANCVERPPGGPPCAPLGKICGVEQHLPELIDAIHEVSSGSIGPYFESTQRRICEKCSYRHSKFCPCPMDYLLVLIVEAVETVDARNARRRFARQHHRQGDRPKLDEIRRLYEEAKDSWTGCDWQTYFGKSELDLNGWTAARARAQAESCKGKKEEADWSAAADWLARVEEQAVRAQEHAATAVRAATAGAWPEALEEARRARACEFATGRLVWRGFPMTWHRFFLAVLDAVPDDQVANSAQATTTP